MHVKPPFTCRTFIICPKSCSLGHHFVSTSSYGKAFICVHLFPSSTLFPSLQKKTPHISSVCKVWLFVTLLWAPWIQPTTLIYLVLFYNTCCLQYSALTNEQIVQRETLELNRINQTDFTEKFYRKLYQNTKEHQQSIKLSPKVTTH